MLDGDLCLGVAVTSPETGERLFPEPNGFRAALLLPVASSAGQLRPWWS